jgi:hypothetical protein
MATARHEMIQQGVLRQMVALKRAQQMKRTGRDSVPSLRLVDIHHISARHTKTSVRAQVDARVVG